MKVFVRFLRLAHSEKLVSAILACAALGIAVVQILEPVLFGRVIDALTKEDDFLRYLAGWIGLGIVNATLSIFLSVAADRFAHRRRLQTLGAAFDRTIALTENYRPITDSGKLVRTILAGTDQVFYASLSFYRENLIALTGVFILVPIAMSIQFKLACALVGLAVVYLGCNLAIVRRAHKKQAVVELRHQEVAARLVDVFANLSIIRSFTRARDESRSFAKLRTAVLEEQYPILNWWGVINVITRLSSMIAMVAIVGIGSYLVHRGEATAGQVVTFVSFSSLLIGRLDQFASFFNRIVSQSATLKNLFAVIDEPVQEAVLPASGAKDQVSALSGGVEFENVTFRYRPDGAGVTNINFVAAAGQTVALVGPSGSGKTTCLALLQRLYSPSLGRIMIDGTDIQAMNVAELCGAVATVFQDPGLFNRSIYENILVGRPEATREEVEAAARKADAHDFISARPGGYDFVVGERGLALSGGERQRLAIARAILKDAPILVLDEATSALDNETEKKIQAAMDRLREGKTTFVIAHRLSTVVTADQILVMAAGRIVQRGTFLGLQQEGGLFARLLRAGQLEATPAHADPTLLHEIRNDAAV